MEKNFDMSIIFTAAAFAVAFVLGLGTGWFVFNDNSTLSEESLEVISGENNRMKEGESVLRSPVGLATDYEVNVTPQLPGNNVFLSSLRLVKSVWVAIHEDTDGNPGRILGARFFMPESSAGQVELLRETLAGNSYYAVVHEDDGNREFDFRMDAPILDPFGNVIMKKFNVVQPGSPHDFGL